jgi:hypothetical protein
MSARAELLLAAACRNKLRAFLSTLFHLLLIEGSVQKIQTVQHSA